MVCVQNKIKHDLRFQSEEERNRPRRRIEKQQLLQLLWRQSVLFRSPLDSNSVPGGRYVSAHVKSHFTRGATLLRAKLCLIFDKGNDDWPFSAALIAFQLNAVLIQRDKSTSLYLGLNLLSLLSCGEFPSISFCHFFTFIFFSSVVCLIQVWSPQQLNYDLPPHI